MPRDGHRPQRTSRIPGKWPALALALAVHAVFIVVLVFSMRWQNRPAAPIEAELYAPPPKAPVAEKPVPPPPPKPEPKPEPQPEPKPAPLKPPPPKVEPKIEKPDTRAADIALRKKQEEDKKQRERELQEQAKREAAKKAADDKRLAEARERQAREEQALRDQAEREQKAQAEAAARAKAQAEVAARARAEADWIRRIQAKVKGNVILPPDLAGNPEAIFDVVQLPTGEIIDVQLRKSSGVRAYDDAVQRAILKSSPLPKPDRADMFERTLTLRFRPVD